jgi:hypothetical protein
VAKKMPARKGRGREAEASGDFEVEDVEAAAPAKAAAGIETWLVFVTLAALIAAFVMINMKMRADFGAGWPA